jgi:uncharacterized protein
MEAPLVSLLSPSSQRTRPLVRKPNFAFDENTDPRWNNRNPDFAAVANALSLLMPHLEPYVVREVRGSFARIATDPVYEAPNGLLDQARAYVRQEAQHHVEHRRFNDVLATRYRTTLLERWMAKTFHWLSNRKSENFGLSFAAGAETVAFTIAQWLDRRVDSLVDVNDPTAALFLWHLGEEAEHRSIAYDVMIAAGGTKRSYLKGMLASFTVMLWFIFLGVLTIQWRDRRIFNPMSWLRIIWWFLTFMFNAIPLMAVTAMRDTHPSDLADPQNLVHWLDEYDRAHPEASRSRHEGSVSTIANRTFRCPITVLSGHDHLGGAEIHNEPLHGAEPDLDHLIPTESVA